jgi:hypothetical protein
MYHRTSRRSVLSNLPSYTAPCTPNAVIAIDIEHATEGSYDFLLTR